VKAEVSPAHRSASTYLRTLRADPRTPVRQHDGGWLYRIAPTDDVPEATGPYVPAVERDPGADVGHFVVIACTAHDDHEGHRDLVRALIPAGWVCFAQFHSPAGGWDAHHYGPPYPEETL
jgi:hypothetical protein